MSQLPNVPATNRPNHRKTRVLKLQIYAADSPRDKQGLKISVSELIIEMELCAQQEMIVYRCKWSP